MNTEEPEEKVIQWDFRSTSSDPAQVAPIKVKRADHCGKCTKHVELDEKTQMVHCCSCGRVMSAFEFVRLLSADGEMYERSLRDARDEVKRMETFMAETKRRLEALKGQLRRAGGKPPTPLEIWKLERDGKGVA